MRDQLLESYILQYERSGRNASRRKIEIQKYLNFISIEHFNRFDYGSVQSWIRKRETSLCERARASAQNHIADFASWAQLFDKSIGSIPKYGKIRVDRRKPIILRDDQIFGIMNRQSLKKSQKNINPKTFSTITGLLYATGLRIGEVVWLSNDHIDFSERNIYVTSGKGERDRLVPICSSTVEALEKYAVWREKVRPRSRRFFIFDKKKPKSPEGIYRSNFNEITASMGLRDQNSIGFTRSNLTVHDLRHSFAVNALINVYENDADINEAVVQLSSILGHEKIEDTYWYIEAVPELVSAAFMKVSS